MGDFSNRHDEKLQEIMRQEGNSVPAFFNAVFGYLSRNCPEKIYDSSQISGEHLINQSFCKWRDKYLHEKLQKCKLSEQCDGMDIPPVVAEEVVVTQNEAMCQESAKSSTSGNGNIGNLNTNTRKDILAVYKKGSSFIAADSTTRDSYAWSQTIEDLEVRVPVPAIIKKGKQVRVQLQTRSIEVNFLDSTTWTLVISGELLHSIRVEESLWSLVPGEHILINLEKKEQRWWNRLITTETPIDLQKIDAERDFNTLPAEEQEKIRELVWNKQQQEQGKPTSDRLKMESMLREAWHADGSPFKGQAYNPSMINFATGSNFGVD